MQFDAINVSHVGSRIPRALHSLCARLLHRSRQAMSEASAPKAVGLQTKDKASVALSDLKERANETKEKAKAKAVVALGDMKTQANGTKDETVALVCNPQFQMLLSRSWLPSKRPPGAKIV